MAGSMTDYMENALLDHIFGGQATPVPATLYLGLFTSAPSDSAAGTEVSGGSYARKSVARNQTNFPAASGGSVALHPVTTFVTPTGDWGTVVAVGIFDALTSGNLLYWQDGLSKVIQNGDTVDFQADQLVVTQS